MIQKNDSTGCVIFQPASYSTPECPVNIISKLFSSFSLKEFIKFEVNGKTGSLKKEFQKTFGDIDFPQKLLFISHGNFATFSFDSLSGPLGAEWWDIENEKFFIVAHSCHSAKILSHPNWKNKFKDWIGSKDKVWFCLNKDYYEVWSIFFHKLCKGLLETQNAIELKKTMSTFYFDALYESSVNSKSVTSFTIAAGRNISVLTCKSEFV